MSAQPTLRYGQPYLQTDGSWVRNCWAEWGTEVRVEFTLSEMEYQSPGARQLAEQRMLNQAGLVYGKLRA